MSISSNEVEHYVNIWLGLKPYVSTKDQLEACEKFLSIVDEEVCDLSENYQEWVGFDSKIDKIIREHYVSYEEHEHDEDDWE